MVMLTVAAMVTISKAVIMATPRCSRIIGRFIDCFRDRFAISGPDLLRQGLFEQDAGILSMVNSLRRGDEFPPSLLRVE